MTREVHIDGVRYVPATEAAPSIEAIAQGLLMRFWGVASGERLRELMQDDDIRVYVNDSGSGYKLSDVLGDIATAIRDAEGKGGSDGTR